MGVNSIGNRTVGGHRSSPARLSRRTTVYSRQSRRPCRQSDRGKTDSDARRGSGGRPFREQLRRVARAKTNDHRFRFVKILGSLYRLGDGEFIVPIERGDDARRSRWRSEARDKRPEKNRTAFNIFKMAEIQSIVDLAKME